MVKTNELVLSEAKKNAFTKLLGKDSFDNFEWLGFTTDLYNLLCGKEDMIDFINDYYLEYGKLLRYASKHFGTKYTERLKKHKDEYESLYKEFDLKDYLKSTKVIVEDEVIEPSVLDVAKAYCYVDDANLPIIDGNMKVAIRALMRKQLSMDDPVGARRELLKSVSKIERVSRTYSYRFNNR